KKQRPSCCRRTGAADAGDQGEPADRTVAEDGPDGMPPKGYLPVRCARFGRSGRVAEGGALLRRYGGKNFRRGFESLLLRPRAVPSPAVRRSRGRYTAR